MTGVIGDTLGDLAPSMRPCALAWHHGPTEGELARTEAWLEAQARRARDARRITRELAPRMVEAVRNLRGGGTWL